MTARTAPVLDFPLPTAIDPVLRRTLELLRQHFGKVTSLLSVALHVEHGATAVVAVAGGTSLPATKTTLDLADSGVDQFRVVGYGSANIAATSVNVVYTPGNVLLATAALANGAAARFVGAWMGWPKSVPVGGDLPVEVQVIGNGVGIETLYRVELQARTNRRV